MWACALSPCPVSLGSCPSSLGISFFICDRDGLVPGTHQDLILLHLSSLQCVCRKYILEHVPCHVASCFVVQFYACVSEKFHWLVGGLSLWLLSACVSPLFFDSCPLSFVCSLGKWLVPDWVCVFLCKSRIPEVWVQIGLEAIVLLGAVLYSFSCSRGAEGQTQWLF